MNTARWRRRAAHRIAAPVAAVGAALTCFIPSDEGPSRRVMVTEVLTLQRLDPAEFYVASGFQEIAPPARCDTTGTGGQAPILVSCRWHMAEGATGGAARSAPGAALVLAPPLPLRLGDRLVVRASATADGISAAELALRPITDQLGPSAIRFTIDTIGLFSVGKMRVAVHAVGFPEAVPDTIEVFTFGARIAPPCGTPLTPPCGVDSLTIGQSLAIRGGPFGTLRDPNTGTVLSVVPQPVVTVGGVSAPILDVTDTLLRVAVPAGAAPTAGVSFVRLTTLGVPAACTIDRSAGCYAAANHDVLPWDYLESGPQGADSLPLTLDSAFGSYPALALEGTATPWAVDATGRARDWYAFSLNAPTVVDIEVTSAFPLDVRVSDTLVWDAVRARPRLAAGAWAVGSLPACQGMELPIDFPERTRGGNKRLTVPLGAGRHHLVVSGVSTTRGPVGYGLTLSRSTAAPDDDGRCDSAQPLSQMVQGTLEGSFDLDWYAFTSTTTEYTDLVASAPVDPPELVVVRDALPDSLPVIATGNGRAQPLFTPGRHLVAVAAASGPSPYELTTQPSAFGPPVALDLVGIPTAVANCEARDVTVSVRDALGRRVLAYNGAVVFSSTDPAATVPATYAFTAADSGRRRFPGGVVLRTEGAQTVSVTGSTPPGLVGAVSATVTPPQFRVNASPSAAVVAAGNQVSFTGSVVTTCGDAASAPVTWASLNPARATMAGNTATGVASGQVTVRADAGSAPTYVHLTVTAPRPATPITWSSLVGTIPGENLRAVWAAGSNAVWAVGTPGLILRFDGAAWSVDRRTGVAADTLFGVWGTGPADIWAVGTGGTVLHFDGTSWTALPSETSRTLRAVWAGSPVEVWMVGDAATILRYDGLTFRSVPVTEHPNVDHIMVWGRIPSDVWIGGTKNTLRRHDGSALTTLTFREQEPGGPGRVLRVQGMWGVKATDLRYWAVCVFVTALQWCGNDAETFRFDGTRIAPAELPPNRNLAQSVLGTDDTEFWYLSTLALVAGTGSSWTTLAQQGTPPWECDIELGGVRSLLGDAAAAFASLPGDVWVVGTCQRREFNYALILRGRY